MYITYYYIIQQIEANGLVGFHQAGLPQLLLIVQGEGWVTSEVRQKVPVTAGSAVFWDNGEWHETGSDNGMTAIVIESETLDPEKYMVVKHVQI